MKFEPPMCPHCGFDLRLDEPMFDEDTFMDPRGILIHKGQQIILPHGQFWVLWSIFKNRGRPISLDALLGRLGAEECEYNLVDVQISKARKTFEDLGFVLPVFRKDNAYRWGEVVTVETYYNFPEAVND